MGIDRQTALCRCHFGALPRVGTRSSRIVSEPIHLPLSHIQRLSIVTLTWNPYTAGSIGIFAFDHGLSGVVGSIGDLKLDGWRSQITMARLTIPSMPRISAHRSMVLATISPSNRKATPNTWNSISHCRTTRWMDEGRDCGVLSASAGRNCTRRPADDHEAHRPRAIRWERRLISFVFFSFFLNRLSRPAAGYDIFVSILRDNAVTRSPTMRNFFTVT
jgi:hypothetical protein